LLPPVTKNTLFFNCKSIFFSSFPKPGQTLTQFTTFSFYIHHIPAMRKKQSGIYSPYGDKHNQKQNEKEILPALACRTT